MRIGYEMVNAWSWLYATSANWIDVFINFHYILNVWMFGALFFFQLHNNWRNAFLITEVEWTNHNTRNAIFRVEYLKIFPYLIVTLLTYYQIVWLLSGFKCQPYMTTIQPYICYLSFPFFTSFREAIADFLNDHMKPVEPILPENVCKIMDRYKTEIASTIINSEQKFSCWE